MGTKAIRTAVDIAEDQHDRPRNGNQASHAESDQTADGRTRIADVLGSVFFLMSVALAAWVLMGSGVSHPTWL